MFPSPCCLTNDFDCERGKTRRYDNAINDRARVVAAPDVALSREPSTPSCLYEVLMAILPSHRPLSSSSSSLVSMSQNTIPCRQPRGTNLECLNPRLCQHVPVTRAKIIPGYVTLFSLSLRTPSNVSTYLADYRDTPSASHALRIRIVRLARDLIRLVSFRRSS